ESSELLGEINRLKVQEVKFLDTIDNLEVKAAKFNDELLNEQALHRETRHILNEFRKNNDVVRAEIEGIFAGFNQEKDAMSAALLAKDQQLADFKEILFRAQRDRDANVSAKKAVDARCVGLENE